MKIGIVLKNLDMVRDYIEQNFPKCVSKTKYLNYLEAWEGEEVVWYKDLDRYGKNLCAYVVGLNNKKMKIEMDREKWWKAMRLMGDWIDLSQAHRYLGWEVGEYLKYAPKPRLVLYDLFWKGTKMFRVKAKLDDLLKKHFCILPYIDIYEIKFETRSRRGSMEMLNIKENNKLP